MYKELIKNNIQNLSPAMIKGYGKTINIIINDSEANILYQFVMKNYSEILDGNEKSFRELKKQINPALYHQLLSLYKEQKQKYL